MSPAESVAEILAKLSEEFGNTLELDEDGLLTLEWGGGIPVTIVAPDAGEAFYLYGALFSLPVDKPSEPILLELLRHNLPGNLRRGLALAVSGDAVALVETAAAAGQTPAGFKAAIQAYLRDAAAVGSSLRSFIRELSEVQFAAGRQPAGTTASINPSLSPEELLKANMLQQNVRF